MATDSLLSYIIKSGRSESVPVQFLERLALEDVIMPSLRNTQKLADYLAGLEGKLFPYERTSLKISTSKHEATWVERLENKLSRGYKPNEIMESIYNGLTPVESSSAWKVYSAKSEVVNKSNYPELNEIFESALAKGGLKDRPRLILHHSDIPAASAKRFPGCRPFIDVTTNYIDILNDAEFQGVLLHEISHLRDNSHPLKAAALVYYDGAQGLGNFLRPREFRADRFAARALNDADPIITTEIAGRDRVAELKQFAQNTHRALSDSETPVSQLTPIWPSFIEGYRNTDIKVAPSSDGVHRWIDRFTQSHPTSLERMDSVTEHFRERKPSSH